MKIKKDIGEIAKGSRFFGKIPILIALTVNLMTVKTI